MEAITHVHPAVPILLWGPIVTTLLVRSFAVLELPWFYALTLLGFGTFVWTLTEYLLHRFVFHFEATSKLGKRFVYLFHGIHHDSPNDSSRLVMPPLPAVAIAAVCLALFWAILGGGAVEPFFAGFLIGYLSYDYIHYYVHFFTPTTRIGKALKSHHMLHHFAANEAKWGVSSPFWDYVFGTIGNKK